MSLKYREIDHTADIGLEIKADTPSELFRNAAYGYYRLLFGGMNVKGAEQTKVITLHEQTLADLLVSWLSELNYLLQVEHFIPAELPKISVQENDRRVELSAELHGRKNREYPAQAKFEIKAVTYHQLTIEHDHKGYRTRIFFDI